MKHKKTVAIGAVLLSAVLIVVGTFAWFTTTDKVENVFQMDAFDVVITEAFDNTDVPLMPGANITKEVGVSNNGNVDVVVRVKLEETLQLLEMETDGAGGTVDKIKTVYENTDAKTAEEGYVPATISEDMAQAYQEDGYNPFTTTGYDELNGITVLRKETTTGSNTVYSYLAYKTNTDPAYYHLVKLTPVIGTGDAAAPESFTVEYAYHQYKNAAGQNGDGAVGNASGLTVTHGTAGDAKLDAYFGGSSGDFHQAVTLNFASHVQRDGGALGADTVWYLADDGYFYYTKPLTGSTISDPLLESVSIAEGVENAFKGATYTITPVMEAVQVDHDAVKASWAELEPNYPTTGAAVSSGGDQEQLVFNVVEFGAANKTSKT